MTSSKKQFLSLEEIQESGLQIVEDWEQLDELRQDVYGVMKKKKIDLDKVLLMMNMDEKEFQQAITSYPSQLTIVQALKLSKILKQPVDSLFQLGKDAWMIDYPMKPRIKQYLNLLSLETFSKEEMILEIEKTGHKYFNRETREPMTETEYQKRLNIKLRVHPQTDVHDIIHQYQQTHPCIYARLVNNVSELFN